MSADLGDREHRTYLLVVLGAGMVLLWVVPAFSSYWLDETITAWITEDGLGESLRRALDHQPMFPTYYVVAWVARTIGGQREWVLRFPSIVAMALATFALTRLGTRLLDRETGLLGAVVFAVSVPGAYAATDARPYAMGLLALVVAGLLLARWLDERRVLDAAGFVVAAALVVYVHYLLATALLAHVVYAVRRRRAVGWTALLVAAVAFLVLLLPLLPWFLDTYDRRSSLAMSSGTLRGVALAIAPPTVVAAILVGALFSGRGLRAEATDLRAGRDEVVFLATWALSPPLLLFVASRISGAGVFASRYLLAALPAVALLTGAAARMLRPPRARRTIMALFLFISILFVGAFVHTTDGGGVEDWRGAAAAVNDLVTDPSTPVVIQSGLIETEHVALLRDPAWTAYLLAPTSPYPVEGEPIPATFGTSGAEAAYLDELSERLGDADRFVVVARNGEPAVLAWLKGRLTPDFTSRIVGRFGDVVVLEFERSASP